MITRASTGILGRTDKVTPEEDLRTIEFVIGLIWRCLAIVFLYGGLRRMKYSVKQQHVIWHYDTYPSTGFKASRHNSPVQ